MVPPGGTEFCQALDTRSLAAAAPEIQHPSEAAIRTQIICAVRKCDATCECWGNMRLVTATTCAAVRQRP